MAPSVVRAVDLKERLFGAMPSSSWHPRDSYKLARSASISPSALDDSGATLDHFLDRHGAVSGQPFADRRLLNVAAGLRPEHLVSGQDTKHVLRRVHRRVAPTGYDVQSSKAVLSRPSRRSALETQRDELLAGLDLAADRSDWFRVDLVSRMRDKSLSGEFDLEALRVARLAHWLRVVDPT
jgi:hypothetical protein